MGAAAWMPASPGLVPRRAILYSPRVVSSSPCFQLARNAHLHRRTKIILSPISAGNTVHEDFLPSLTTHHSDCSPEQDPDVQPEGPVLDVVVVKASSLG